jgi:thiamine biosynthesis lipoprotein
VNRHAHGRSTAIRRLKVSPLFGRVLREALNAARLTGGLCVPTVLDALEAAGYDRDFALLTSSRTPPLADAAGWTIQSPRVVPRTAGPGLVRRRRLRPTRPLADLTSSWRRIRFVPARYQISLPTHTRLDLAGVAKGWTADRVADLLAPFGSCLVDAGGDLAARLAPHDVEPWPIAIADPLAPERDLDLVMLRNHGIATSGTDFRRWTSGGQPRHHLIDPRTGEPSDTDVLTATVVAHSTCDADAHAKAALLLGASRGRNYLVRRRLAGLIVRRDGVVVTTPRWSDFAYRC